MVRRDGPAVLIAGVIAIAAVWLVGVVVSADAIGDADLELVRDVAARRTAWADTASEWGTQLAETLPVAVLSFALAGAAWWRWRRWSAVVFVAVAIGGEKLIYLVSSILVGRDRPDVETLGTTYATHSFPSGHVASAVSLYGSAALLLGLALGRRWRAAAVVATITIAVIVAACRVYRGFHYVSDVLVGAALGALWLTWCWRRFAPHIEPTVSGPTARVSSSAVSSHRAEPARPAGPPNPLH